MRAGKIFIADLKELGLLNQAGHVQELSRTTPFNTYSKVKTIKIVLWVPCST